MAEFWCVRNGDHHVTVNPGSIPGAPTGNSEVIVMSPRLGTALPRLAN